MSRRVLSILAVLWSFSSIAFAASDPLAQALAAARRNDVYCFDSSEYHDPMTTMCRAIKGTGNAEVVAGTIAEQLRVRRETARELALTATDGAGDDHDALPQVAFRGTPTAETAALVSAFAPFKLGGGRIVVGVAEPVATAESACDIRTSLFGGSVLFVAGERTLFAPMAIDRRTIVLTDKELEAYTKKFGPTYAARIQHFVIDQSGTRAIIEINESWTGRTYLLKKTKDGWEIERCLSNWIT